MLFQTKTFQLAYSKCSARTGPAAACSPPSIRPAVTYLDLDLIAAGTGRPPFVSTQTIYDVSIASNLFNYLNSKSS